MNFMLLVARATSHSFAALTREILLLPLEHKIHIFSPPCNILYLSDAEIFGKLRQFLENAASETFVWPSDNFCRIFGNQWQVFGNLRKIVKRSSVVCLYTNKEHYMRACGYEFDPVWCSAPYLSRSLRSLVRYRVEHSKIKFVSTRGHQ